ncbi:PDZ domain-containing protein [Thiocapsa marina]|uniref:PDZ/DHR/GLGF domain protein n=1 Tax=Thiocapsa marina 5811 TaxID=768671 RepID=F9UGA1_9GAMM|nr:PDZ domain-containing protein [Thiocapsa marina]EGV16827.1 PDZ/DHR/GLGF domain protein [Thiocapsa marina 5811]
MQSAARLLSAGFAFGAFFGAVAVAGYIALNEPAPSARSETDAFVEEQTDEHIPTALGVTEGAAAPAEMPPDVPTVSAGDTPTPQALRSLESQITDLRVRLSSVEQSLTRVLSASETAAKAADETRPPAPRTAEERRGALVAAGVDPGLAEDLVLREAQRSLERLSLRDQAIREGWLGSAEYREELSRINADARSLREEIGDEIYDRYLFATGEENRVKIDSVIPGSAAEIAGLQPGDLIEAYAEERLFDFSELRRKTTEGEYGEQVAVRVRRGGRVVETWIPRGPLGVTLNSARVEPDR